METDYSKINKEYFERTVRDYAIYRVIGSQNAVDGEEEEVMK
jgi:hypothetical protein